MRPPDTVIGPVFQQNWPSPGVRDKARARIERSFSKGLDGRKDRRIIRRPDSLKGLCFLNGSPRPGEAKREGDPD